jgi:hypothetical protein
LAAAPARCLGRALAAWIRHAAQPLHFAENLGPFRLIALFPEPCPWELGSCCEKGARAPGARVGDLETSARDWKGGGWVAGPRRMRGEEVAKWTEKEGYNEL